MVFEIKCTYSVLGRGATVDHSLAFSRPGKVVASSSSRVATVEFASSTVAPRLGPFCVIHPALERPGYVQSPLRGSVSTFNFPKTISPQSSLLLLG
jgi:hypothetical protein